MDSSISIAKERINSNPDNSSVSKLKTYGFTIAIILGIAGLAVEAAGLVGYFHVGGLSNMAQLDAMIMIAAGGGGGALLLIIVSTIKNRKSISHQPNSIPSPIVTPLPTAPVDPSRPLDTKDGLFYGPEAWEKLHVKVLDIVPDPPKVDLSQKEVLLYIPQTITIYGKKRDFNLRTLKEIVGKFAFLCDYMIESQFQDVAPPAPGKWVLIDKTELPGSLGKCYKPLQEMIKEKNCSLPSLLEAAVLNLMVYTFTRKKVPYTYCLEQNAGGSPISVGMNFMNKLFFNTTEREGEHGVLCIQREFPKIIST